MIFRQLFDSVSYTYTYLIASIKDREAVIIDPVLDKVGLYLQLINELGLKLVYTLDTHVHADHITGSGQLISDTEATYAMGKQSKVDLVSLKIQEGDQLRLGDVVLEAIYTPGHTDDSYCYKMQDRVFTGDTLLIRGTGRTDFQSGDPYQAYESLFNKLLCLPEEMLVYPAHDYRGIMVSTIGEEKKFNPRLQVKSAEEYAALMNTLNLPYPQMMDVAIPANLKGGVR